MEKVQTGIKNGVFIYTCPLTVEQFSQKANIHVNEIIKYFFSRGISVTINSLLTVEQIGEICLANNLDFQVKEEATIETVLGNLKNNSSSTGSSRPPIVTIMGHVDHGKTTLLDALRKSNLTKNEKGGITQHIGSYQVEYNGRKVTFIDTPGHEAFTEMRARGANITDIVVLVVAADDGMKPQTEEAIDHAKQANVPIIVFLNKMDKPSVNVDLVFTQLANKNLTPEEWNGDTIVVKGSALKGEGINQLLEHILALGELYDLRADPNMLPFGIVMDAKITPGLGIQASVIVLQGTLLVGDQILIGSSYGKVRVIVDDAGRFIKSAGPSQPVKISGLGKLPNAGDKFVSVDSDKSTRDVIDKFLQSANRSKIADFQISKTASNSGKTVNLILKTDAHGSLEAIKSLLAKITNSFDEIAINVVRIAIGAISEGDIRLAQVSNAIIISFNLPVSKVIVDLANSLKVQIKSYDVIYALQKELADLLGSYLDPVYDEKIVGEAIVRKLWFHSKIGTIAGCCVTSGKIVRKMLCRIIRDQQTVYQSSVTSLRQEKNDVNEVGTNIECGIVVKNFNDIKVNDIIQNYEVVMLPKK